MGIAILFAVFGVLLLIGVPVAYALAAAALAAAHAIAALGRARLDMLPLPSSMIATLTGGAGFTVSETRDQSER